MEQSGKNGIERNIAVREATTQKDQAAIMEQNGDHVSRCGTDKTSTSPAKTLSREQNMVSMMGPHKHPDERPRSPKKNWPNTRMSKKNCMKRKTPPTGVEFDLAGRSNFLQVDLDAILHNINTLRARCSPHTEVIAVIKGNAYGHGSVALARHLYSQGIQHFAVATAYEGQELRQAGVQGFIQVFGNCVGEEVALMRHYQMTPTVTTHTFLTQWAAWPGPKQVKIPGVIIKVDTGMSRNGCQPEDLPNIVKLCDELGVPIHSLMTHFAQAWDDDDFSQCQLHSFLTAVQPYRDRGIKLHAANSAAIIRGLATDLDFIRPGICMYGLPPDPSEETIRVIQDLGLRPALCWIARPNLVKRLAPGRHVGYDQTYKLEKEETIATFAIGYADGFNRLLSNKGILTTMDGEEQRLVGRVSMDAITVAVKDDTTTETPFYIYTDRYSSPNSMAAVARMIGTIPYEVGTSLAYRMPRLYVTGTSVFTVDGKAATLSAVLDRNGLLDGQGSSKRQKTENSA